MPTASTPPIEYRRLPDQCARCGHTEGMHFETFSGAWYGCAHCDSYRLCQGFTREKKDGRRTRGAPV